MTEKKPSTFFKVWSVKQSFETTISYVRAKNPSQAWNKIIKAGIPGRVCIERVLKKRFPYGVKIIE